MSKFLKAACILIAVISVYAIFVYWQNVQVVAFDRAEWLRDREALETVSLWDEYALPGMARDLVATRRLVGQSRSDVIALLGEAENYQSAESQKLYYFLRIEYRGIDPSMSEQMVVKLDQSDTVVAVEMEVWKEK